MSREKNWQIPRIGITYNIPEWVEQNCDKIITNDSFKLKDGSIAGPGDWLILKDGQLTKK